MRRVSYIVTVYNKAVYLPFVVAGLSAQTGAFEREFVFVNDGSTDDSLRVLEATTAGLERVRILTQANAGPAVALNKGFAAATGDLLKPVDGDDMLAPWASARLIEALDETGCRWAVAGQDGPRYALTDAPEAALGRLPQPAGAAPPRKVDLIARTLRTPQTNPSSWLAQASAVREVGGCDERVFVQDYSVELRLAAAFPAGEIAEAVHAAPDEMGARLSGNQAQILHDATLALAWHMADGRAIPQPLAGRAVRRAAHRAWKWAQRRAGATILSDAFRLDAAAWLGLAPQSAETVFKAAGVFSKRYPVRLAPPDARSGLAAN